MRNTNRKVIPEVEREISKHLEPKYIQGFYVEDSKKVDVMGGGVGR